MKPPASIKVGPFDYTVLTDKTTCEQAVCVYGQTMASRGTILLNPEQAPSQMRDTLLHEILHAAVDAASLSVGESAPINDATEEQIVRALSPWILQAIRDNPRLVAFLTEK